MWYTLYIMNIWENLHTCIIKTLRNRIAYIYIKKHLSEYKTILQYVVLYIFKEFIKNLFYIFLYIYF